MAYLALCDIKDVVVSLGNDNHLFLHTLGEGYGFDQVDGSSDQRRLFQAFTRRSVKSLNYPVP